ncbi:hypothetical protein B0J14DRAFT_287066 [Halenospora varia]|nr:hypothetical protein B0J14DRAFT_287066 [Halenospora varia]
MYLGVFIYMGADMPLYGFSLFPPPIVSNMGYKDTSTTQQMTVPLYTFAAVLTIIVGIYADWTGRHGLCNTSIHIIGVAGSGCCLRPVDIMLSMQERFLVLSEYIPYIANTISSMSNNIEGSYKRGMLGFVIG